MSNERCTLLSETIGKEVIKTTLDKSESENARVILYITKGGCIYSHSHDKTQNPDSEVYIDLLKIFEKGVYNLTELPEIAGSNSPTSKLEHSIEQRNYPQIILAIKKGQEQGIWDNFSNDFVRYFQSLGVTVKQNGDKIRITSNANGTREEVITINIKTKTITYFNGIEQEFVSLDSLQNPRNSEQERLNSDGEEQGDE